MAVAVDAVEHAESAILRVLQSESTPISIQSLKSRVREEGLDNSSIVSAIWFLIDRNKISLGTDLKLSPSLP